MSTGYVKLHRKMTENQLWLDEPFTKGQAWVDMLMLANHQDGHVCRCGLKVKIRQGEIGYSYRSLADRWKWSKAKVQRFIEFLVSSKMCDTRIDTPNKPLTTVICLINFKKYQVTDTESGTEQEVKELSIVEDLNQKGGFRFKLTASTKGMIKARLAEGFTADDFFTVHDNMIAAWKNDPKMSQYLRPSTLYRESKFQGYLNMKPVAICTTPSWL